MDADLNQRPLEFRQMGDLKKKKKMEPKQYLGPSSMGPETQKISPPPPLLARKIVELVG